jgi:catechol 1,2-dioxygenase
MGFALVGPFYRANAPMHKRGESIASDDAKGDRVHITGRVLDLTANAPVAGAVLEVWRAATNGLYENQDKTNMTTISAADSRRLPTPYPVPTDGPVGELIRLAKRQPCLDPAGARHD